MKKNKVIMCQDCDEKNEAEFWIEYTIYWRIDYHWKKRVPICHACLDNVLGDGMMGGGGPTSSDIIQITVIHPEEQRGYHYRWDYLITMLRFKWDMFKSRRRKKDKFLKSLSK